MSFGAFVGGRHSAGRLVVQPRMGIADPGLMREALLATKGLVADTAGTVTLDSYTRIGWHQAARSAWEQGQELNGYPLVAHGPQTTRRMLDGVADPDFPVQVRHGSARPSRIVEAMRASGLHATEGGPVSYCLPYGRVGLDEALADWTLACRRLTTVRDQGVEPHVETFGGCMLGQLCPPGLLVAISVLEAVYFRSQGLRSVSVSYAQQTDDTQDQEAVHALRRLCAEHLAGIEWHVVVYAYMGVYPRTPRGARALLASATRLAVRSGAARLIVKTVAEAHRLPTPRENLEALELAGAEARRHAPAVMPSEDTEVYLEARTLVGAVLGLDNNPGRALVRAVRRGLLDIPYCLHPENAGRARSILGRDGRLLWAQTGAMPIRASVDGGRKRAATAEGLIDALHFVQRKFDATAAVGGTARERAERACSRQTPGHQLGAKQ